MPKSSSSPSRRGNAQQGDHAVNHVLHISVKEEILVLVQKGRKKILTRRPLRISKPKTRKVVGNSCQETKADFLCNYQKTIDPNNMSYTIKKKRHAYHQPSSAECRYDVAFSPQDGRRPWARRSRYLQVRCKTHEKTNEN